MEEGFAKDYLKFDASSSSSSTSDKILCSILFMFLPLDTAI
jgi:hypothetical protein